MIHDNLIDTIISRAYECIDNYDYINAVKIYERAWKKVCDNISKDNIVSLKEYEEKYESDDFISDWVGVYIDALQCCFEETGDKEYLERIIDFEKNYNKFFKSDEYFSIAIIEYVSKAKFCLGKQREAIEYLKSSVKEYSKNDIIYDILSELYIKMNMYKEAKEVLKEGIKKCECNVYLEEMLKEIEKEEKRAKR